MIRIIRVLVVAVALGLVAASPGAAQAKGGFDLAGLGPGIVPFEGLPKAQGLAAEGKTVVLFFAATWCPTCVATYKELKGNAAAVPREIVIVFVDYDKERDLKTRYGVSYQHTFVVIGKDGGRLRVWNGTVKLADLVAKARG